MFQDKRMSWAVAVVGVLVANLPATLPSATAQAADHVQALMDPLADFNFYVGTWEHPERDGMKVIMEWVFDGRVLQWTEIGSGPDGGTPSMFARGLIGYDAADDKIVFHDFFGGSPSDFFGGRQMMFYGEYQVLGEDRLRRSFTAHYGQGWNDQPPSGSKIEFRETWEPVGQNGWRWSSEIKQNNEWRQYQPPVVMVRARS